MQPCVERIKEVSGSSAGLQPSGALVTLSQLAVTTSTMSVLAANLPVVGTDAKISCPHGTHPALLRMHSFAISNSFTDASSLPQAMHQARSSTLALLQQHTSLLELLSGRLHALTASELNLTTITTAFLSTCTAISLSGFGLL